MFRFNFVKRSFWMWVYRKISWPMCRKWFAEMSLLFMVGHPWWNIVRIVIAFVLIMHINLIIDATINYSMMLSLNIYFKRTRSVSIINNVMQLVFSWLSRSALWVYPFWRVSSIFGSSREHNYVFCECFHPSVSSLVPDDF